MAASASSRHTRSAVDTTLCPEGSEPGQAIRTEGLQKAYPGGVVAVHGLDLSVRTGEIFGLLGPNGAGKTTTVGMLTTRVIPTAGRAWVGGVDVVGEPARAKQAFGVVSQGNTLDPTLTVWENLYFHGRYFGASSKEARQASDAWLEAFRLASKGSVPVSALSGGMARRLMLARAMLHGPAVVFLDEPTAGLDPQSRRALWEIIIELHAGGQTVLLTTHYMEEADRFCDRVAIMDHGEILALDKPSGLRSLVPAAVTATVKAEGDLDVLAQRLGTVEGALGAWSLDGYVQVHLRSPDDALGKIATAAARDGFTVTDVSVNEASLESVFLSLTGEQLRE